MPKKERATNKQLRVRAGAKRNELDLAKDTFWIVGEVAKGRTYRDVAEELNKMNGYQLDVKTVWRDVERAMVEWKRMNMDNIDALMAKECARIEYIEGEVRKNLELSKKPRPNEVAQLMKCGYTKEEIDAMYDPAQGGQELPGDPRFFDTLLRLQYQRLKLFGLDRGNDSPTRLSINQYNFNTTDLSQLTSLATQMQDRKREELVDEQ